MNTSLSTKLKLGITNERKKNMKDLKMIQDFDLLMNLLIMENEGFVIKRDLSIQLLLQMLLRVGILSANYKGNLHIFQMMQAYLIMNRINQLKELMSIKSFKNNIQKLKLISVKQNPT